MKTTIKQIVSYEKLAYDEINELIDSMLITIATKKYNARLEELPKYNNKINDKQDAIIAKLRGLLRKC